MEHTPVVRTTIDQHGIVTLWMDAPGKPVNTCSPQFFDDMAKVLDGLERDVPRAVIVASAKPRSFSAGADLNELSSMDRAGRRAYLQQGQRVFARMRALPCPTVAAINADALGGGYEVALACKNRIAAEGPGVSVGLPETKLGLLPAWGGTTYLPRLTGLREAMSIVMGGKTLDSRKAVAAGLVDHFAPAAGLMEAAARLALAPPATRTERMEADWEPQLDAARADTLARTFGNLPAPLRVLDVLRAGFSGGVAAGLDAELEGILDLLESAACEGLIRVFFLRQGAKKRLAAKLPATPLAVQRVAVVGGGTMGSGIAHAMARAGYDVTIVERDAGAAEAAMGRVQAILATDVRDGRLTEAGLSEVTARLRPGTDDVGLATADLVVEAAFEDMLAKRAVFERLGRVCRPEAILATNTSSLRVAEIAKAVADPGRVIGLHFFNPVPKMPLVEIVQGPQSRPEPLATAAAVAAKLGKVAVLVADAPGFVVNRLLIPYLAEALVAAEEGMSIEWVDAALKQWGMPMGPLELLDEIGLDVSAALLTVGPRGREHPLLKAALAKGWMGKKSGCGFYMHSGGKGKATPNDGLAKGTNTGDAAAIAQRLMLAMLNEGAAVLREGVVDSADTIDLAMVTGAGFAPFRGGLMAWGRRVGAREVRRQLESLAAAHGDRFRPDAGLEATLK